MSIQTVASGFVFCSVAKTDVSGTKGRIFGSLAQFERDLICERTRLDSRPSVPAAGRASGETRRETGQRGTALIRVQDGDGGQIAAMMGIGRSTIYRYLSVDSIKTD